MYYELYQTCKSEDKDKMLQGSIKYLERFHLSSNGYYLSEPSQHEAGSARGDAMDLDHAENRSISLLLRNDFVEFRYYWLRGIINTLLKLFTPATFYFDNAKLIFKQLNSLFPPPTIIQQFVSFPPPSLFLLLFSLIFHPLCFLSFLILPSLPSPSFPLSSFFLLSPIPPSFPPSFPSFSFSLFPSLPSFFLLSPIPFFSPFLCWIF